MPSLIAPNHAVLSASTGTAQSAAEGIGFLFGFAGGLGNGLAWASEHITWIVGVGAVIGLGEHVQKSQSRERSEAMAGDLAEIRRSVGSCDAAGRPDAPTTTALPRSDERGDPR